MVNARSRISATALCVAAIALLAGAGEAGATTFCVPTFGPDCPNANGNVAEADLEKAMNLNNKDGVADTIVVAGGTFVEDNDYETRAASKTSAASNRTAPTT